MPNPNLRENRLERTIAEYLCSPDGGYICGHESTYDRSRAIDMTVLTSFVQQTQQHEWEKLTNLFGDAASDKLYEAFAHAVERDGIIKTLRNEVALYGCRFRLCYFAPISRLNDLQQERFERNILTCTRQLHYSNSNANSIDIALSLNGIPLVAIELKCQFTGQTVENSMRQWREDRDPNELLFRFNHRIVAFFGVDLEQAVMTTRLCGSATRFVPFNQGSAGAGEPGGKGNPPSEEDQLPVAYLWEKVWRRENLMRILQSYVMLAKTEHTKIITDRHGRERTASTTSKSILFPRYHQLDVVERLLGDTLENGAGHNYLVQHSAGSGKSNSIAWLTYRLASLHNENDESVFDGVFVVTDRRALNSQLSDTILSFGNTLGQVTTVNENDNSECLAQAIRDGHRIVVTTLQRFGYIYDRIPPNSGKRYAIIIDEAHSSQNGRAADEMVATLADIDSALQEYAARSADEENAAPDVFGQIINRLAREGRHDNLSCYAFTATPKPETLQLFGVPTGATDEHGNPRYRAYHTYSMRQAIEEGFIVDVLRNYVSYSTTFEVARNSPLNPEYENRPATQALLRFVQNHPVTLEAKTKEIVERFRDTTLQQLDGKGKAMVVCSSRMHALVMFFSIRDYCREHNIRDIHPLVAFSGELSLDGKTYTEPQVNSTDRRRISEEQLPKYFASDMYNMLIVADKYQTGFDEPRLTTMFVDKGLGGIRAVQTLSRLNRAMDGKDEVYVFDFVNDTEQIRRSFEPYYTCTELVNPTDFNKIYDLASVINDYRLWTADDVERTAALQMEASTADENTQQAELYNLLQPVRARYEALEVEQRYEVRGNIRAFVRLYGIVSKMFRYFDAELLKLYVFCDVLLTVLRGERRTEVELKKYVRLAYFKMKAKARESIRLSGEPEINGSGFGGGTPPEDETSPLEQIIALVNERYGGAVSDEDRRNMADIYNNLESEHGEELRRTAERSGEQQFVSDIFPAAFRPLTRQLYRQNLEQYQSLFADNEKYTQIENIMGKVLFNTYNSGFMAGSQLR